MCRDRHPGHVPRRGQELRRPDARREEAQPGREARRALDTPRPLGLGQDHLSHDARRVRDGDRRRDRPERPADQRGAAVPARHRHRLPALRAVPAPDGGRERGVPARGAEVFAGGRGGAGGARARDRPARGVGGPPAGPALGWPAATRGGGARPRLRTPARADGRATGRAGPATPRADAVRDQAPPRAARRDDRLRDSRPVGSVDPVRSHRGVRRRRGPAARIAGGAVRTAGERVRGALHR